MALTTGDVTKKDQPFVNPEATTVPGPLPEETDPGTGSVGTAPVETASTEPSIVTDLSDIQTAVPPAVHGLSPSIAQEMTLPFIPPGFSQAQIDAVREQHIKILDDQMGERARRERDLDQRDREFEARMERLNAAIGHDADNLHPWNAEREMASRKHDLWEQFGSPGFLVAMMASSFTTMPMVSALNGGAAAMNAINAGDIDGYDKAFDAWKQNTELVLKRMRIEQDMFENLDKLRTRNYTRWKEELALKLDNFGDQRKKVMLENGLDEDVIKSYEALERARGQIASNYQAQIENKALFDGIQNELKKNGGNWFAAYATTLEALNRAKNAGKWSGSDQRLWDKAEELFPGDPKAQTDYVTEQKRAMKGETAASIVAGQKDKIRKDVEKEQEGDPNWTAGKTEEEVEKKWTAAHKGEQKGISVDLQNQIKANLASALGVSKLPPELESTLNQAYAAKGVNAPKIVGALNAELEKIEKERAEGKEVTVADASKRIDDTIAVATQTAARSAATQFVAQWEREHKGATADQKARVAFLFANTMKKAQALGTREAGIVTSLREVKPLGEKAIAEREKAGGSSNVTLFNSWEQVREAQVGTKGHGALQVYTAGVITAYAGAIARGGNATTVEAQRRAMGLVSTAYGTKAFAERINTMIDEMEIINSAVKKVEHEELRLRDDTGEKPRSKDILEIH